MSSSSSAASSSASSSSSSLAGSGASTATTTSSRYQALLKQRQQQQERAASTAKPSAIGQGLKRAASSSSVLGSSVSSSISSLSSSSSSAAVTAVEAAVATAVSEAHEAAKAQYQNELAAAKGEVGALQARVRELELLAAQEAAARAEVETHAVVAEGKCSELENTVRHLNALLNTTLGNNSSSGNGKNPGEHGERAVSSSSSSEPPSGLSPSLAPNRASGVLAVSSAGNAAAPAAPSSAARGGRRTHIPTLNRATASPMVASSTQPPPRSLPDPVQGVRSNLADLTNSLGQEAEEGTTAQGPHSSIHSKRSLRSSSSLHPSPGPEKGLSASFSSSVATVGLPRCDHVTGFAEAINTEPDYGEDENENIAMESGVENQKGRGACRTDTRASKRRRSTVSVTSDEGVEFL